MATKQNTNLQAPDGSYYVTTTDGAGNLSGIGAGLNPAGATVVTSSSGNVAASAATATLAGTAGKTTYISGFYFTGGGATGASVVNGTITGLLGGTATFNIPVPAGATAGVVPLYIDYNPPLPASAVNTSIVVSVPSLGAGNTNAAVSAWGYQI
jgi:hypothetical protein